MLEMGKSRMGHFLDSQFWAKNDEKCLRTFGQWLECLSLFYAEGDERWTDERRTGPDDFTLAKVRGRNEQDEPPLSGGLQSTFACADDDSSSYKKD